MELSASLSCSVQLLACIGEQFTEGEEICGVVVNVRAKQDKLCIWTKSASNEAAQVSNSSNLYYFNPYAQGGTGHGACRR